MTDPTEPTKPPETLEPPEARGTWPGVGTVGTPASSPPPPPPPPRPPDRPGLASPDRRWLAAAAVAALIVLVGAVLAVATRDSDKDERAATTDSSTEQSTDPTTTTSEATESSSTESSSSSSSDTTEFDAVIDDIKQFVERERGLQYKEDVKVELAGEGEFQTLLLEDFDEEIPTLKEEQEVLVALDLLDPDANVVEEFRSLLEIGVVGFYDQKTGKLVVRGTDTGPYVRQVIAHELVHALDDQYFDLDREALEKADDETGFGFTALAEGNARRIEDLYANSLSLQEQQQAFQDQLELQAGFIDEILSIPSILLDLLQLPYEKGPDLIEAILDSGGQERLDESFGAPPTTSEQVLDPDRYLAGEGAVAITPPTSDGTASNKGALGQYLIEQVLSEGVDDDVADAAVEGWGGDSYVTWADPSGQTCIRFTVAGDTPADTDEFAAAFDEWKADHGGTTELVSGQSVTVTSCH